MFSLLYGLWEYLVRKDELRLLILGLDKAGKTTLLEKLKVGTFTCSPSFSDVVPCCAAQRLAGTCVQDGWLRSMPRAGAVHGRARIRAQFDSADGGPECGKGGGLSRAAAVLGSGRAGGPAIHLGQVLRRSTRACICGGLNPTGQARTCHVDPINMCQPSQQSDVARLSPGNADLTTNPALLPSQLVIDCSGAVLKRACFCGGLFFLFRRIRPWRAKSPIPEQALRGACQEARTHGCTH